MNGDPRASLLADGAGAAATGASKGAAAEGAAKGTAAEGAAAKGGGSRRPHTSVASPANSPRRGRAGGVARAQGRDRPRGVHDLGRSRTGEHASADASHVRGPWPDRAAPLAEGHPPVLAPGRGEAETHSGDDREPGPQPGRGRARARPRAGRSRRCTRASSRSKWTRCAPRCAAEELEEVRRSFRAELVAPSRESKELVRAADVMSPFRPAPRGSRDFTLRSRGPR